MLLGSATGVAMASRMFDNVNLRMLRAQPASNIVKAFGSLEWLQIGSFWVGFRQMSKRGGVSHPTRR
jgi:hypothetical protein